MKALHKKIIQGTKTGFFGLPPNDTQPTSPAAAASPAPPIEHRAFVRHLCDIGAAVDAWPARIQNISRGGVKVIVTRRFEVGTNLKLEIHVSIEDEVFMLPAKVVRVESEPSGSWCLGCAFVQEITEEEVRELLTNDEP
jgi:hypothetical protein